MPASVVLGDDDLQLGADSQSQNIGPLALQVGAHAVADAGDHPLGVHFLALLAAAQVQGVQTLLRIDPVCHLGKLPMGCTRLTLPFQPAFSLAISKK